MTKPLNAGSLSYNNEGIHSGALVAVTDAQYTFLYVDAEAEGGASDGGTLKHCNFHEAVYEDRSGLPQPEPIPNDDRAIPYHVVGDDWWGLRYENGAAKTLYSHRSQVPRETDSLQLYRLSRARRVIESTFCIMAHRNVIYWFFALMLLPCCIHLYSIPFRRVKPGICHDTTFQSASSDVVLHWIGRCLSQEQPE